MFIMSIIKSDLNDFYNFKLPSPIHIVAILLYMFIPLLVQGQEVLVINNKGTKILVRNTSISTGTTAPATPVIGDVWFDTSVPDHQRVMVWTKTIWKELTFTGKPGSVFFAGPDGIPTQNNSQFFWNEVNNRLGIGTSSPTQSLDVDGYARIRNMDNGEDTDQIMKVDVSGTLHTSKVNYGGRWINTDVSTNLNVDDTVVPIFGQHDYVDDGTNLYEVSGNTLIVKVAGRYDIRANIALLGLRDDRFFGSNDQNTNVNARIAVNGIPVGALAASGAIAFRNNNDHSSIHINEILHLNANDVISIISYREANIESVVFSGSGTSSFIINKLR